MVNFTDTSTGQASSLSPLQLDNAERIQHTLTLSITHAGSFSSSSIALRFTPTAQKPDHDTRFRSHSNAPNTTHGEKTMKAGEEPLTSKSQLGSFLLFRHRLQGSFLPSSEIPGMLQRFPQLLPLAAFPG